ncbi:hypothetical protein NL676_039242 [Syzygium grande]|nr:hypothetical protein NL676_039242 [Syzygium grande]
MLRTAFTLTVDAKHGITKCVSARDRATMVLALASRRFENLKISTGRDIFSLLKYREGGVLKRAVHTAASVDLAVLDGLEPMVVLCEVVDDDGSVARLPKLRKFAQRENLKIVSIADLIRATLEMVKKVAGRGVLMYLQGHEGRGIGYGWTIAGRVPPVTPITNENKTYLETKRSKLGHIYGESVNGHFSNLIGKKG